MSLREELIQVAAVAVAMIEDLDSGLGLGDDYVGTDLAATPDVLVEVLDERRSQEVKWGPRHHDIQTWLTILMEEVGESANAALEEVMFPAPNAIS